MKLDPPPRDDSRRAEPVAPMINVVFLLLIFFLMTATLAPPDPIETIPPISVSEAETSRERTLHVGADGTLALGELRGDAAVAALTPGERIAIRADRRARASEIAALLARLRTLGVQDVHLTVERR